MRAASAPDLGAIVRDRRKVLGLTQSELAERIGATRAWVISLEKGKESVELGLVLRTLAALDLELDIARAPSSARAVAAGSDAASDSRRAQVTARLLRTLASTVAPGAGEGPAGVLPGAVGAAGAASGAAAFDFLHPQVRAARDAANARTSRTGAHQTSTTVIEDVE